MERLFTDPRCLEHAVPAGVPEQPRRLRDILARARADGRRIESDAGAALAPAADDRALEAVHAIHENAYVARLRRAVARGDGLIDSADNPLSPGTWDAALGAVSAALAAADWVAAGDDRQAFAAVRPPGHHAERAVAMGFCYLANVAIAAQHLIDRHGVARLAIVDFDVHHGNGTQHIFERRGDVLFVSLHQYPFYPGTGAAAECGRGAGAGATLNLPLPAGTGDDGYAEAFEDSVLPALASFAPEVLLVSAGFDAWRADPLGGMAVSEAAFGRWGRWLRAAAERSCRGRMLSVLEGGYDLARLPDLASAYLDGVAAAQVFGQETLTSSDFGE